MGRPKLGDGDTQRLHLKVSDNELERIDDWRFANRVPNRSDAIRRLCQIGLRADAQIDAVSERAQAVMDTFEGLIEADEIKGPEGDELLPRFGGLFLALQGLRAELVELRAAGDIEARRAAADEIRRAAEEKVRGNPMSLGKGDGEGRS